MIKNRRTGHIKMLPLPKYIWKAKLVNCWLCCGWITFPDFETMDSLEQCIGHCDEKKVYAKLKA